jgi:hypothetical protein
MNVFVKLFPDPTTNGGSVAASTDVQSGISFTYIVLFPPSKQDTANIFPITIFGH